MAKKQRPLKRQIRRINKNTISILKSLNITNFVYSSTFYKYPVDCLINQKNKIVISNKKNAPSIKNQYDYTFITFNNVKELNDVNFINVIKEKIEKHKKIQEFANKLNNNLPNSEVWFRNKLKEHRRLLKMNFTFNTTFKGMFICDVISIKYNVIIEVDGSYHDLPEQKIKDAYKDSVYRNNGFTVYRVKAYDDESFNSCISALKTIIRIKRKNNVRIKDIDKQRKKHILSDTKIIKYINSTNIKVNQNDFKDKINMIDFNKKLPF